MNLSLNFNTKSLEIAIYVTNVWRGWFKVWAQRSPNYKRGFVLRCLCFGFVLRHGYQKPKLKLPISFYFPNDEEPWLSP